MLQILNQYTSDGQEIIEYTRDGKTISAVIKTAIPENTEPLDPFQPQPTIEEKILAETQYQTMLLELTTMGGM